MNTLQEFLIKSAGMEKKALNLAALLRMSRNAANKGRLHRFSDLLDKRNRAIANVTQARDAATEAHWPIAYTESRLLGHYNGPEAEAHRRLADRLIDMRGSRSNIKRIIKFRNETPDADLANRPIIGLDLYDGVTGPWTLEDLATYSAKQKPSNPIDKLTYPDL